MANLDQEVSFPRGGVSKIRDDKVSHNVKSTQLFRNLPEKKTPTPKKKSSKATEIINKSVITDLTLQNIVEGMLILGCIDEIRTYEIVVSLPGKLRGRVPITNVSQIWSKWLSTESTNFEMPSLASTFTLGQLVVTKVMHIDQAKHHIELSMNPRDVHSHFNIDLVKVGMVLTGALVELEDHGYLVDLGIESVICHMKHEELQPDAAKGAALGKLVRCLITKVTSASGRVVVKVTADAEKVNNATTPANVKINQHLVIPGLKFVLQFTQATFNGWQVKWEGFDGYIHEHHVPKDADPVHFKWSRTPATALYTLPTIRKTYFTLKQPREFEAQKESIVPSQISLSIGDIVDSAKVLQSRRSGITVDLRGAKGYIPRNSICDKLSYVPENLKEIFSLDSMLTCRLVNYFAMDQIFLCTMKKSILRERCYTKSDLQIGCKVSCTVMSILETGLIVQIGVNRKLAAFVPDIYVRDSTQKPLRVGDQAVGRVLFVDDTKVHITLRKSMMNSKKPILSSYTNFDPMEWYVGVKCYVGRTFYKVAFYNNVQGYVNLSDVTKHILPINKRGQLVACRVASVVLNKMTLITEMENSNLTSRPHIVPGQEFIGRVLQVSNVGVHIKTKGEEKMFGLIPLLQMSEHPSLAKALSLSYKVGQRINVKFLVQGPGIAYFTLNKTLMKGITAAPAELTVNSVYPCIVDGIGKHGVFVRICTYPSVEKLGYAPQNLTDAPVNCLSDFYQIGQGLFAKLVKITEAVANDFTVGHVSLKLADVTSCNEAFNTDLLESFLEQTLEKEELRPGALINGVVERVSEDKAILKLQDGSTGIISHHHMQDMKLETEQNVTCMMLRPNRVLKQHDVTVSNKYIKSVNHKQDLCEKPKITSILRAEVLFCSVECVVAALKGKYHGVLVYLPRKFHLNQTSDDTFHPGNIIKVVITKVSQSFIICVPKALWNTNKGGPTADELHDVESGAANAVSPSDRNPQSSNKKRKNTEQISNEDMACAEAAGETLRTKKSKKVSSPSDCNGKAEVPPAKKQRKDGSRKTKQDSSNVKQSKKKSVLISPDGKSVSEQTCEMKTSDLKTKRKETSTRELIAPFVWDEKYDSDASSVESDVEMSDANYENNQKKPLTMSEKRELRKKEEERLAAAERKFEDDEKLGPTSADDFDRLLMAHPNSSLIWVQYMSFHLQATEIEKARCIAMRALKTIDRTEENERFYVWTALLNLEYEFGKENLDKVVRDALLCNDTYKVYNAFLNILEEAKDVEAATEVIRKMIQKNKGKIYWIRAGTAYYRLGKFKEAAELLQRSASSLSVVDHIEVVRKFSSLEIEHFRPEQGFATYEHILGNWPNRVDIWCEFIDALVKEHRLDAARNALERAVAGKLKTRHMKIMYGKFIDFEKKYGDEEKVNCVRDQAKEYISNMNL